MKVFLRALAVSSGLVMLIVVAFLAWASLAWTDDELRQAEVISIDSAPASPKVFEKGMPLKVMDWNIGFGGGLTGNPTDRHPASEVSANLSKIAAEIRRESPDIVFIQEVDKPSSRTGRIDQVEYLLKNTGMSHVCFVATWKSNYVPSPIFPLSGHIGPVHSGQLILSKFPIKECRRVPLPQPPENSWWYNRFYLRRALQHAIIKVDGIGEMDVVNVHLEAFSTPNRQHQAELAAEYVGGPGGDRPLIMAGDFNSLPPFSVKTRGFIDEDIDFTNDSTIETIRAIPGLREVVIDDVRDVTESSFHTFPAVEPTRRLDYIFYRNMTGSVYAEVPRKARSSDHLPVVAEIRL
jgi:endonuclease/exonuclease/phosphatase family metal-dependent hydrolase